MLPKMDSNFIYLSVTAIGIYFLTGAVYNTIKILKELRKFKNMIKETDPSGISEKMNFITQIGKKVHNIDQGRTSDETSNLSCNLKHRDNILGTIDLHENEAHTTNNEHSQPQTSFEAKENFLSKSTEV